MDHAIYPKFGDADIARKRRELAPKQLEGFRAFSARASAANFDGEALARAVEYAHFHHVRVHVTVNTLVKEGELEAVYAALETIAHARADAIIVQDLGVVQLCRQIATGVPIHGSTQMTVHSLPGVLLCGSGARRGGAVSGIAGHNAAMAVLESR